MSGKISGNMERALALLSTLKPKDAAKQAGVTLNALYIAMRREKAKNDSH